MGGIESQWLVGGTGARQRGSLWRLLAELGDKDGEQEETDLAQSWDAGKEVGQEVREREGVFAELGEGARIKDWKGLGAQGWLSTLSRGCQRGRDKTEDKGAEGDWTGSDTDCEGRKAS